MPVNNRGDSGRFKPANEPNRFRTERIKNCRWINVRVRFQLLPVLEATFQNVRRSGLRKTILLQWLTSSVLIPRSREVGRQMAREREFWASARGTQCGG